MKTKQGLDTSTPAGRAMFQMTGVSLRRIRASDDSERVGAAWRGLWRRARR